MSDERWRDQILSSSTEHLVECNGASFLAFMLKREVQEQRDLIARHTTEVGAYVAANRGALAVVDLVQAAARSGRKTIRVDEVLAAYRGAEK